MITAATYYTDTIDEVLYKRRRVLTVILLQIASLGLYSFVWFYQNWRQVNNNTGSHISPFLRSIFNIFFAYPFFSGVADTASNIGLGGKNILRLLGVGHLFAHLFLMDAFEEYFILQIFSSIIVIFDIAWVQYKINQINFTINRKKMDVVSQLDAFLGVVIVAEIALIIRFVWE